MRSTAPGRQMPTGSAVVGDPIAAARNLRAGARGNNATGFAREGKIIPMEEVETRYYLRLRVAPEPGVLGTVTGCCGAEGVELASLDVKNWGKDSADLHIRTQRAKEKAFRRLLAALGREPQIYAVESAIPIEGEG